MIGLRDRCYKLWLRNVRFEMSKLQHVWQPIIQLGSSFEKYAGFNSLKRFCNCKSVKTSEKKLKR